MIGDVGVFGDNLGELPYPQTVTFLINNVFVVVVKSYVSVNVAFGEFGEGRVALSACLEGGDV